MFSKRQSPNRNQQARNRPEPRLRQPGGVEQNRAFSYYAARSQTELNTGRMNPVEQPSRQRPRTFLRLIASHKRAILIGIILLLGALYNMQLNTSTPKVAALTSSSDAPFLRQTAVYEKAAASILSGSAANRNKLTINASAVAAKLKQQFPELRDVSVALPILGSQPVVYIQPSRPAALLTNTSGTFVIDEHGRALIAGSAGTDAERFKVPVVLDQSHLSIQVGQSVIASSTAVFIQTVMQQLQAQHIAISRMVLPANASELDVYPAGKPYFIKFNLQDEQSDAAELQTGAYTAISQYLDGKGITPAAYVDVRLPGRAYYR